MSSSAGESQNWRSEKQKVCINSFSGALRLCAEYIYSLLVMQDDLSLTKAEDQMELETLRGVALTTLNDSIADYTVALADVRGEVSILRASVSK